MASPSVKVLRRSSRLFSRVCNKTPGCRWISVNYHEALSHSETSVTTVKNQLRVASECTPAATATVGIWADAGSRYENSKNNGVSHFLEHMIFKGTSKRSQSDLETEVENLGMQLRAHSGREHFGLYAKCLSKDVPKAVEILADIVQNSTFSDADVDRESAVVLRELQEAESDVKTVAMDYLYASAFQGTSLGFSKYGTTDTVKWLTRKELSDFVKTNFKPPHMVLAAAGGVDHTELISLADKLFSNMSLTYEHEIPTPSTCRFTGSEVRARYDDLPLAHVALAVEGAPFASRDSFALMVASAVIGSWERTYGAGANSASVLASRCAQEEMAQCFESFYKQYSDTGLWGIYFKSDRLMIEDTMFNVQGEWMRLCSSLTEFEVQRARNQLKLQLLSGLDGTTPICHDIARQVLYTGHRIGPDELNSAIESVSAKTVRDVCMKYIYDRCPAIVGVGPTEGLPDYNRMRAGMYWVRL